MPPKIRDLMKRLELAGFINRGGKGSHKNFKHPLGIRITISGKLGMDAGQYQILDVKKAILRAKK